MFRFHEIQYFLVTSHFTKDRHFSTVTYVCKAECKTTNTFYMNIILKYLLHLTLKLLKKLFFISTNEGLVIVFIHVCNIRNCNIRDQIIRNYGLRVSQAPKTITMWLSLRRYLHCLLKAVWDEHYCKKSTCYHNRKRYVYIIQIGNLFSPKY